MARIRTVKPEYWSDEKIGPMDPIDRLVFLGLISMADDAGRLLDNLKQIDAFIFPYTDDTAGPSLTRLHRSARIRRGLTESGQKVIEIVNWDRHQRIDRPNLSAAFSEIVAEIPSDGETDDYGTIDEGSSKLRRNVADDASNHTNDLRPTTYDLQRVVEPSTNRFPEFWAAYPKRSGGNPRGKAESVFRVAVRNGTDPAEIIAGAKRYAAYLDATGKLGTQYVKQAQYWLAPSYRGWEQDWTPPADAMTDVYAGITFVGDE